MNNKRQLHDCRGRMLSIGDTVKWEQESGDQILVFTGRISHINDYVRIETETGDLVELLWPYDLPDAQLEKIGPEKGD